MANMSSKSRLNRPFVRCLFLVVSAVASAAAAECTPFKEDPSTGDTAPPPNLSTGPPCDGSMPFRPPVPVPGLSEDVARTIAGLRLSADYLTAYFYDDTTGNKDIYYATRETPDGPFSNVRPIPGRGINTVSDETDPTVSGDGLTILFARGTPVADPIHIFQGSRPTTELSFASIGRIPQLENLNATYETFPFLREDGIVLYFSLENADIYVTRLEVSHSDANLDDPKPVAELNTTFSEIAPVITFDDLTIYYGSDRGDGQGNYDIWMATRASSSDLFGPPTNVTEVNSADDEWPSFVTRDGCTLYFTSNRDGYLLPYVATRRRVDTSE
jgi:hypothetical protein